MRPDLKKNYSSREVASITGLSARQLQWWDSRKLIKPSIASHRTEAGGFTERRYSPVDLFELVVLADLRRNGLSVSKMRLLVETLRKRFGIRLFDAIGGGGAITLLTDGNRCVRAHRERPVFQSVARTKPAAAGRRERRHAEGAEAANAIEAASKKKIDAIGCTVNEKPASDPSRSGRSFRGLLRGAR